MPLYWYLDGHEAKPIPGDDARSWAALRPEGAARGAWRVAETHYPEYGDAWVSTVFLGMDHQFDPDGPPLIFETMIFADDHPDIDQDCERYSTWEEAEAGHAAMVQRFLDHIASKEDS